MWTYKQPTEIVFGVGTRKRLPEMAARFGGRAVLVTDAGLRTMPMVSEALELLGPDAVLFAEVEPNPTVGAVDKLAALLREHNADVAVALGGGSSLDCAKAACSVACHEGSTRQYHSEGKVLDSRHLPLITIPTTAGTGSEVTPISVLDDPEKGIKAPMAHDNFFAKIAIVDPELTLTLPRHVTAMTGFDALSHAIEGYWSKNHQPICDLMALESISLAFKHLPSVLADGSNMDARVGMSMAALLGGLAFQLPKNAAVHACSFSLSSIYHMPHGAACAFTLDHFVRFNAPAMGDRGIALAKAAGFADMNDLADAIAAMKVEAGLPTTLGEVGIGEGALDDLVKGCFHPLMNNNPRPVSAEELKSLYLRMQ
jgi:alcohol dehydrogenase